MMEAGANLTDTKVRQTGTLEPLAEIVLGDAGLGLEDGQRNGPLSDRCPLRFLGDHIMTV